MGSSHSSSRVNFAPTPVQVQVHGDAKGTDESVSLRDLIETKCPSLFGEFRPAWYLFNGHLQTMYCVVGDFSKSDQVIYERTYLRLIDGGTLGLDFTPPDEQVVSEQAPCIVVTHGLTGGSYESYVKSILAPACTPVKDGGLGYRAVVVNFRGCADVPITSPQLYSAGHTDDLRQALMYIRKRYPHAPLLGVGFSLGANVLTRYIAEEGENCRLVAGCALACPWDLKKNNDRLNNSITGRYIYSQSMGGNLLAILKRHADELSKYQDERIAEALPKGLALKSPTMEDFDDTFTRVAGGSSPPFPFASAIDYYNWASSHKVLGDIRIPFLAINAADDPVVRDVPMDAAGNGWVTMALSRGGGHLGWFEPAPTGGVQRWIKKPVLEWLKITGEQIVYSGERGPELYELDGFLKERGRDHLGIKEIDGGGPVLAKAKGGLFQGL